MIYILYALFLAILVNIDSIFLSTSYTIKDIKFKKVYKILISFCIMILSYIAIYFSKFIMDNLEISIFNIIGAIILIVIGAIIVFKTLVSKEKSNFYLQDIDYNKSKNIELLEVLILALALSLDSIFISISIVFTCSKTTILLFPIIIAITQYLFFYLGNIIGKKFINIIKKSINERTLNIVSGLIFILIGITRLI